MEGHIKEYVTICKKKLASGEVREYHIINRYTVKNPPLIITAEMIDEMQRKHAMGVPKSKICAEFGVSYYKLQKYLA